MTREEIKDKTYANPLTFRSEDDFLECFTHHRPPYKYGLEFNGKYEFYKTFPGLNNRANYYINKYKLTNQK